MRDNSPRSEATFALLQVTLRELQFVVPPQAVLVATRVTGQ